jgi:hypothetical protein
VVAGAQANRSFLVRVVRYLAGRRGIFQFLDIGTGLPAPGSTHEVAQAIAPESRIVYVDHDPLVLAHARALLTSKPEGACDYVEADLRDTGTILAQAAWTLDLTQPVALLLLAVLHFVPDTDNPAGIVATLAAGLAPGSYIAISHLTADFAPGQVSAAAAAYNTLAPVSVTPRSHTQVSVLFGGLPLVPPGIVPVTQWRPAAGTGPAACADLYAGLATTRSLRDQPRPPLPAGTPLPRPAPPPAARPGTSASSPARKGASVSTRYDRCGDDQAVAPTLAHVQEQFPCYRIWQETAGGQTRYVARRQRGSTGPHTLITPDLEELRAGLAGSGPPALLGGLA